MNMHAQNSSREQGDKTIPDRKIAVLTTGGTIGSLLGDYAISIERSGNTLRKRIYDLADTSGAQIEVFPVSNVASPNLEPEDWVAFSEKIAACKADGFRRFIITHGTDTLHFTSTFLALQFHGSDLKICVTGAFFPINHENSDANANVIAAFETVTDDRLIDGVYAAFADPKTGSPAVVPALDLMPPLYDEPAFRSVFDKSPEVINTIEHSDSIFSRINWSLERRLLTKRDLIAAKTNVMLFAKMIGRLPT